MNNSNHILSNYKKEKLNVNSLVIRFSIFSFLSLFTLLSTAQVTVKTDTTKIRIGEQIQLQYFVDKQEGVQFPKLALDSLRKMEVVKSFDVDTVKNQLIKKYALTSFDSGKYTLPQQLINIKGKKHFTKPIIIDVGTIAVDTTKQKLFPIKSVQSQKLDVKDYAKNYWYLFPILLLLGALIWYFFIRKKETEEERIAKIPPFQIAVQQLQDLDKKLLWQNNKTKEYYSELTDIIRVYIEKELKVTALESTTNELVSNIKKINNSNKLDISNKIILKLKDLLQEADLVKFAKSKPFANEIEMHRNYANVILEGLKFEELEIEASENTSENNPESTILREGAEGVSLEEGSVENETANTETKVIITKKKTPFYKNISKKTRNNIIALFAFALMYPIGYKGGTMLFEKIKESLTTVTTEQLFKGEWQLQNVEDASIATPVILQEKQAPSLPDEAKEVITSMHVYAYEDRKNNLQIAIITTTYKEEIIANLEGGVNGAITNVKAQKGVSNMDFKAERLNKSNKEGARVFGTYMENEILSEFEFQLFVENNKMWMLIVSNTADDAFGSQIKQRILESFKMENNAN